MGWWPFAICHLVLFLHSTHLSLEFGCERQQVCASVFHFDVVKSLWVGGLVGWWGGEGKWWGVASDS